MRQGRDEGDYDQQEDGDAGVSHLWGEGSRGAGYKPDALCQAQLTLCEPDVE